MNTRYIDSNNMILPHGENKILFTTIHHYLLRKKLARHSDIFTYLELNAQNIHERLKAKNGTYTAEFTWEDYYKPDKPLNEPWSHDNHTALVSLDLLYKRALKVKRFPLRDSWRRAHPRDISFYLISHSNPLLKSLGYLLSPLLIGAMFWACFFYNEGTSGDRNYSGIQLSWLRTEALGWQKIQNMLGWVLKHKWDLTWKAVFRNYYNDADHPNVKLAQEIL